MGNIIFIHKITQFNILTRILNIVIKIQLRETDMN